MVFMLGLGTCMLAPVMVGATQQAGFFLSAPFGMILMGTGVLIGMVGRIGGWWHHG
jgi:hypothetical protein